MKRLSALILLLLSVVNASAENYEAYYQVSPATEDNHMFVLILLKNLDNENDVSSANFVIEAGEVSEQIKGHVDYPTNRYTFKVQSTEEHGKIFILTDVMVSNGDTTTYKAKQQLSGFNAP